jgi:adenylate cyclase class 2
MAVEIETKLKVDSLSPVRDRLRALKAEFLAHQDQRDLYCDNARQQMVKQDKCLRVRIETTDQGTQSFITFKGPKQEADIKCRQEIEMPVPDTEQARALLEGLGYEQKLAVHKHREVWSYKQCLIGLDQVTDLGTYVEIEGPDSHVIHEVQQDLDLTHVPHCQDSYACLLARNQELTTNN